MASVSDPAPVQPRVFLSHSGADTAAARAFAALLRRNGIDVWFDQDNLQPGDRWMDAIEQAIQQSSAMVVYVGRLGVQHWVDREVRAGLELNTRDHNRFKLIPVFGDGADAARLPPFLSQHQGIAANEPESVRRLLDVLRGGGTPAVPSAYWAAHSPFRSLQAFEPEDAWLFFGRDQDTRELLDRLERSRVQLVIGNSGSGKSSLVRAGVIPALQRGRFRVDGRAVERWRIAIFRPGSDPFGELVDRLPGQLAPELPAAERDALITRWRETFPRGGDAVRNGIAALPVDGSRTLLFADQFEELFTAVTGDQLRQTYIDALLGAADADGVHLIIGVRADFYANCLQYPALKPFLQRNYSVLLMQPDQLREAVEKRLALAGARAEAGLIEALVADVGTEPGNLALLEHTLAQLWAPAIGTYASAPLTNQRYDEIGRLKGAIGTHANHVYGSLTPELQSLARRMFLELVQLGEGAQDTRRRVTKDRLLALDQPETSAGLLDVLTSKRLIASSGGHGEQAAFAEVSHEALIREWADLREWLNQDRDDLRFGRRLAADAEDWAETKDAGTLLRGARLLKAEEWYAAHPETPAIVRQFVIDSRSDENDAQAMRLEQERQLREIAEARERAERQGRQQALAMAAITRRRSRIATVSAMVALVSAVVAGVFWQRARREGDQAKARLAAAQAEYLTTRAEGLARSLPDQSLLLALEARRMAAVPDADALLRAANAAYPYRAVLRGHQGPVTSAWFSGDGRTVVTGSADQTARLWEVASGRELRVLRGHEGWIRSVQFSPDGKTVATAGDDKTARLWEVASGRELRVLRGHRAGVLSVRFSREGNTVMTASPDETGRIWEVSSGRQLHALGGHEGPVVNARFSADGTSVLTVSPEAVRVWDAASGRQLRALRVQTSSAEFSPDGKSVLAADPLGHTARLWDVASGKELWALRGHEDLVRSAQFSPDGKMVLTPGADRTARLWDAQSGKELQVLRGHEDVVRTALLSPDGRMVLTAGDDRTARVWDAVSGEELQVLRGHEDVVGTARFSPDGQMVLTASDDNTARLWDVASNQELRVLRVGKDEDFESAQFSPDSKAVLTIGEDQTARLWDAASGQELVALRGHDEEIQSAGFSPDGKVVLTASDDRTARLWDVTTGKELRVLRGHQGPISSAQFSVDGQTVLTASEDQTARLWDAVSGRELRSLRGHGDKVLIAQFSPDSTAVLTASDDDTARLWDAASGRERRVLHGDGSEVIGAQFSPDGKTVLTANGFDTRLWDAASGRELRALRGHDRPLTSAEFSPDGRTVLTAGYDNTARLWDVASGRELSTLRGHQDLVSSAQFSPDGRTVLTASDDRTARLWDAATGKELRVLRGHQGDIGSARFSPDGKMVVTAGEDDRARLWECRECRPVEEIAAEVAKRVGRELTEDERRQFGLPDPRSPRR